MATQQTEQHETDSSNNAHYMRVTLAILIPIVALAIALPLLWSVSQQANTQSANSLEYSLQPDKINALAQTAGFEATDDIVTSILLLVTSDGDLSSANIVVLNTTQQFAKLLEIDSGAQVSVAGETQALSSYYASAGATGTAAAIAQAGIISIEHIVEMDDQSWNVFLGAVQQGSSDISVDLEQLLDGIKANDMSVRTLREVFSQATQYGFSAASIVQIPTVQTTDSTGSSSLKLDQTQIGLEAGTIR